MSVLLDVGEIEGRAAYIRKQCGMTELPERGFSTSLITDTIFKKVSITGDNGMPKGITEMVVRDKGRFQLYYSRKVGAPSQRIGILHGCYHTITDLADVDGLRECNLEDRKFRQYNPGMELPTERACDLFAGALLVPFFLLNDLAPENLFPARGSVERHLFDDEVDRLASRFQVPAGFMNWRLWDLMHLRRTNFMVG